MRGVLRLGISGYIRFIVFLVGSIVRDHQIAFGNTPLNSSKLETCLINHCAI